MRHVARVRSLKYGAFLWGTAILVQKSCFQRFGSVLCKWWKVGIFISLAQWAFYVMEKASISHCRRWCVPCL